MAASKKNVTFSLPIDLIEKLRIYAKNKYISSINAGVKEALEEFVEDIEKDILKKEMTEASKDPLFMKDLNESMDAFKYSDRETFGGTEEW
jgi:predicted DNA-binding protein